MLPPAQVPFDVLSRGEVFLTCLGFLVAKTYNNINKILSCDCGYMSERFLVDDV
jgi:hypothetical protein